MLGQPAWNTVLRALREARGVSQDGWATRLGYSRRTLQRWEQAKAVPDASAEAALVTLCGSQGLFRPYDHGPLAGLTVTAAWLESLLAAARLAATFPSAAAAANLAGAVPPPHILDRLPTHLPVILTSFIGREQELAELARLLDTTRLLTLTGPGGTGKTRLALRVAGQVIGIFTHGVFFVDLAPLGDPMLVPAAVAQALGVPGQPDVPIRETILRFLGGRRLLLILDNYEHLLAAAEFAGALLQAAPQLALVVTSRAPLRVRGEREFAVSPLPVPAADNADLDAVAANPAVALFVARARDVRADVGLTDENAVAIAAICTRLDGLPLAIELAAARVRTLPPVALLARLEQRLPVLTGGARDVPARQQTLRDTITWSYALLTPPEQTLFRRLSVFAGGCTLGLAEAVCNADRAIRLDVLDGVSALVENSLLHASGGIAVEPRYRMLETMREFALEQLVASGEAETLQWQLAVQMLQLMRHNGGQENWQRLEADLDNARAALAWCIDRANLGTGVRLFWAMRWYLLNHGAGTEHEFWRHRLLSLPEAAQPGISRARLLARLAGHNLQSVLEQERAVAEYEEAISISRQIGDRSCLAQALGQLAELRLRQGKYGAAVLLAEEELALQLAAPATVWRVAARGRLIEAALARGDLATASAQVAANQAEPALQGAALPLRYETWLAEAQGDTVRALALCTEYMRREGADLGEDSPNLLFGLAHLVHVALRQGEIGTAVTTCARSLNLQEVVGPSRFLPFLLHVLARTAQHCGLHRESVRLLAVVAAQRRRFAAEVLNLGTEQQAAVVRGQAALGDVAFSEAWTEGEALSPAASINHAVAVVVELQQQFSDRRVDRIS